MGHDPASHVLRGRRLIIARTLWVALVAPASVLCVVALYARYLMLSAPPDAVRESLAQLGLSTGFYAVYYVVLGTIFGIGCFAVAAVIARRKPNDGMALFVSLFLVLLGAAYGPNAAALEQLSPVLEFPARFAQFLIIACQLLFLFVFPDGRFFPRWGRAPVLVWISLLFVAMLAPGGEALAAGPGLWGAILLATAFPAGVGAQIYRYLRVSAQAQRQQTKWVVFGVTTSIMGFILLVLPAAVFPGVQGPSALVLEMFSEAVVTFATLLIPLSIGVAILRYRLWDIDVIINRTLVYGALTASVVGLYVLVVGGLSALLQVETGFLVSLLATGLVAVLFAPLRDRLQRGVNRLIYGERDDPYGVISRLGQRLESTLAPDAVLPTIVETLQEALRVPYVAISLKGDRTPAASAGEPAGEPLRLPLVYRNEKVGELLLGPRGPGEAFGPADRRLLEDLARQAGVAAHAVRLTADLQRSRQRLVAAREEERRRLRRDLHDGLGAQLAGLNVQTGVLRRLIPEDPAAADEAAVELRTELQSAIADIRRLVYDLRPPALDDLGLVSALRQLADRYGAEDEQLRVSIEAPEDLPHLPAAVEVAAYRISQEALTNVVRHARAQSCVVRLTVADEMMLEITDDGVGLPEEHAAGVGLFSMRERAAELGGTCTVGRAPEGGTRVLVRLPLPEE
ncbi:MAG TPA: sensor histidine kinase [Rubrobacter sp.]|nr:sensor histidine kinase [Rubrobacter sp.]